MKRLIFSLIASLFVAISQAQTVNNLWITGSAVPGGTQQLTKFPISGSSSSCFKFSGKLLPGDLYIVTTEEDKASRYYYAPKLVDSNIVNDGIAWKRTRTREGSEWAVLFEADNYRFTIDPATNGTVKGELFAWWYESWLVGGCVADNQGVKEGEPGHWQITAGRAMKQSLNNPYEWLFTGELKNYTANDEPKRFKINGQYGWGPKVLHPFKQDTRVLDANYQQVCTGGADNKWIIDDDGFYVITTNVFTETIRAEYYKNEHDWTAIEEATAERTVADIRVNGRQVNVTSPQMASVSIYATDGKCVAMQSGTSITMLIPQAGTYIIAVETPEGHTAKKVAVE